MSNYFLETQSHEWILSNKKGSYALGTGNLVPQRKYHSLLTKTDNNFDRYSLVGTMEEMIEWRGENFFLDSNHYNNCIYPEGFLHLVKSWLRPFPVFLFSSLPHNNDILVKKEIVMDENTNCTQIKYTNLSAHKLHFTIRPKFTLRNHHHLNQSGSWDFGDIDAQVWNNEDLNFFKAKRLSNQIEAFGWMQHGFISYNTQIYRNHYYPWEAMRGYPGVEDLISLFDLNFDLKPNESNFILLSDYEPENPNTIVTRIEKRYKKYPVPFDIPTKRKTSTKSSELDIDHDANGILQNLDYDDNNLFDFESYLKILELSLLDFVTDDDIIAGFPWFGAWGRDSMIFLEALNKLPKGPETAWNILKKYGDSRKNGLIPNMCGESGQEGNYTSIDATLWFIIRLYETVELLNKKGNQKQKTLNWKTVIDLTEDTLNYIICEKNDNFRITEEGLLELFFNFSSATWMDAKINQSPVTPRDGAPVEINALLYNALCYYELMIEQYNNIAPESKFYIINNEYVRVKDTLKDSFNKFWINDYLADRIYHGEVIKEYRPNAVIAASLPFTPLSIDKLQQIYECAHIELFTPYGLRTLSPRDSKFKKKYIGDATQRDKAYHQGTAWAWLLLPFIKTWIRAYPNKSSLEAKNHISYLIEKFRNGYIKGHIASIAEVWDGERPHFPKGTPAQAWSVSALYLIENILIDLEANPS
jgi:predicted glycogen debranching enzyme